jgi:hypothetical protein
VADEGEVNPMTPAQLEHLANAVRVSLQNRTCCPKHATDVLLHILASFALDSGQNDPQKAARIFERAASNLTKRIRRGEFTLVRAPG